MFAEAIFRREFIESARQRKLYWASAAYLLALLAALAVMWFTELTKEAGRVAETGRAVLLLILGCQCGLLMLIIPGWVASGLVEEREQNTFWTLFLSRLSPGEIVFGKLLSRVTPLLLVTLSGLPILVLIMDSGGLPWGLLIGGSVGVLAGVVLAAGVAIGFAAHCSTTYGAVFLSFSSIALLLSGLSWLTECTGITAYLELVPFHAIAQAVMATPPPSGVGCVAACLPSLLFCGAIALLAALLATSALYRYTPGGRLRQHRWLGLRIDRLMDRLFPTLWRFGLYSPTHPKADAVAWRETALGSMGVHAGAKLAFMLAMVAASVCVFTVGWFGDDLNFFILCVAVFFLVTHVTTTCALCVSREHERGTLNSLLMLPVEPGSIVRSQFQGVVAGMWLPVAFFTLYCLCLACAGYMNPVAVLVVPATIWMVLRQAAAFGISVSLSQRTQARARAVSLAASVVFSFAFVVFASCCGALHEETIEDMARPHAWWGWPGRVAALLGAGIVWAALLAAATNRTLSGVQLRFERMVHGR